MCTASWGWRHHRSLLKVREPLIPFCRAALQLHQPEERPQDSVALWRSSAKKQLMPSDWVEGETKGVLPSSQESGSHAGLTRLIIKRRAGSSSSSIRAPAGLTKDLPGTQISQLVGKRLGKSSTGADGASTASIVSHSLSTSLTVSLLLKLHGWPGTCCLGQYLQTCTFGGIHPQNSCRSLKL